MKKSRLGRKYNWRPDKPDHRDYMFTRLAPAANAAVLSSVDLRPQCPPVVDQGDIGSCTANSLAGALGFLELKELKNGGTGAQVYASNGQYIPASRLFIYYNERFLEGDVDQDGGAEIRDGVKSLATWGVCREPVWQYNDGLLYQKPSTAAFAEAANHKISGYYRLITLTQIKQCLASGYPVAFGFTVYESFESDQTAQTGIMTVPTMYESVVGGHAVLAVGYDEVKKWLIVRNSWGTSWGDQGYFYMPYQIFDMGMTSDYWTLRK